ncbi:MAG: signal recognition particle receptor subunit alpha [Vulcanisaeta sp.]|nr:MAG: signal recognition particle [Vulcanisaeta sp. CIS_19]MCG2864671.1 signal recognition particle receptor subunit alpha [Vulcanisaeta sp.]MCG2866390.1 signal recognition particle receptor subunit alpha [Vulcanisaeta sp.]MCG2885346.1 signal recognition particle receptor subunit alpha [Vulcanisaeta sp.]PVU72034.1 signal recognition particle protein [Vulcanisaeta sp. SCGC AB-777_J10]
MKPLIDAFTNLIARIRGLNYIDEATLKEVLREIQRILLRADVSADVVSSITKTIEERFRQERPPEGVTSKEFLVYLLYQELVKALGGEGAPSVDITKRPYKLMLIGVEGSGKTTTAAKLARFYIRRNLRVGLIETDVYRPGAYYQLKQLAEKVNALFYGEENSRDPLSILRHGLEYMQRNKVDLVIIDTAGRHRNEEELLKEARAIYDEAKPDEVMLVIDATIGRQAAAQTEAFMRYVPINSVFLTKMDSTAKAGGALTSVIKSGARIKFIGVGEDVDEIEVFDANKFVSRLLGMGDLEALIEKIRAVEEEREIMEEIEEGKLNLLTIKKQLDSMMKLGPLSKIMELLPTSMLPIQYRAIMTDEERMSNAQEMLRRWRHILDSMTKEELLNPEIINASRIRRIAKGAGVTPKDVKELLNYYQLMKRMINQIKKSRRRLGRLIGE